MSANLLTFAPPAAWALKLRACDSLHRAVRYLEKQFLFETVGPRMIANLEARRILIDQQIEIYTQAERELG